MLSKIIQLKEKKEKIHELESLFKRLPDKARHVSELKILLDLYIGTDKYKKAVKVLGQLQNLINKPQSRMITTLQARVLAMRPPLKTEYIPLTRAQIIQWSINEICSGSLITSSRTHRPYETSQQR